MNAQEVIDHLQLVPLPGEGGYWSSIQRDEHGNSIYFLTTPESPSTWHLLQERETWVYLAGDAIALHTFDESSSALKTQNLAPMNFTASIAPGTWMAAATTGSWSLVLTFLAPPFSGMQLLDRAKFEEWRKRVPNLPDLISEIE
jgi:predicted cupin superfamily sugar epimerase